MQATEINQNNKNQLEFKHYEFTNCSNLENVSNIEQSDFKGFIKDSKFSLCIKDYQNLKLKGNLEDNIK